MLGSKRYWAKINYGRPKIEVKRLPDYLREIESIDRPHWWQLRKRWAWRRDVGAKYANISHFIGYCCARYDERHMGENMLSEVMNPEGKTIWIVFKNNKKIGVALTQGDEILGAATIWRNMLTPDEMRAVLLQIPHRYFWGRAGWAKLLCNGNGYKISKYLYEKE